jgi:hypothetical protein
VLLPSGGTHLTDRVLAEWDACEDQGVLRRLSVVAHEVALVFGAASWWISRQEGTMLMESMGCLLRPRRTELLPLDLVTGEQFDIDDYPASKVALDGGSYYGHLDRGRRLRACAGGPHGVHVSAGGGRPRPRRHGLAG